MSCCEVSQAAARAAGQMFCECLFCHKHYKLEVEFSEYPCWVLQKFVVDTPDMVELCGKQAVYAPV
jgi:hypothetical protein